MKLGRRESQSSLWTIALSHHKYELLLSLVFLAHLFLAWKLPPAEDELYYWAWSKQPSLSYFDHPPLIAWLIFISTKIFGNSLLAIRLPAICIHLWLFYQLGKFSEKKAGLSFLLFTPLSFFGAILITPDIPLVLFWLGYLMWSSQIFTDLAKSNHLSTQQWLWGGLWLGLGLLSKYTMGLAPICLALLLITNFPLKTWYRGFLLQGLLAFFLFLPVLFFNYQHHFSPLIFQWNHTHHPAPFKFLFSFVGTQVLLLGALPFLLIPWLASKYRTLNQVPFLKTCFWFFIIPLTFFCYKATHSFLEANWALVAFLSFWPLCSFFLSNTSSQITKWMVLILGFSPSVLVTCLFIIHLFFPLKWIQTHQDRLAKLKSQDSLVHQISTEQKPLTALPIFLTTYQWTSYFKFYGFSKAEQLENTGRSSHFTLAPVNPCAHNTVLFFSHVGDSIPNAFSCFTNKKTVIEVPLVIRDQTQSLWSLVEFSKKGIQE